MHLESMLHKTEDECHGVELCPNLNETVVLLECLSMAYEQHSARQTSGYHALEYDMLLISACHVGPMDSLPD